MYFVEAEVTVSSTTFKFWFNFKELLHNYNSIFLFYYSCPPLFPWPHRLMDIVVFILVCNAKMIDEVWNKLDNNYM